MKIVKRILCLVMALILFLSATPVVRAENESAVEPYVQQILQYYMNYQDKALTDIDRLIHEMGTIDAAQADAWRSIIGYWSNARRSDFLNEGVLPDGLPQDDSLCIVVLGYALYSNGAMQKELVGRLKVALASAQKYPNAYILCTGGGTASGNRSVTEASQMAAWLKSQGISSDRIIMENKSMTTAQNATFSCKILREQYPQVQHLAIVTSDYHVSWGYLSFATEISQAVYVDLVPYMDLVSNAAYPTTSQKGNLTTEVNHITQIAGIRFYNKSKPPLSTLTSLSVQGSQHYYVGDSLKLSVIAGYDSDFSRNVTHLAEISDVEMRIPGTRTIQIRYQENGVEMELSLEIQIHPTPVDDVIYPEEEQVIISTDSPQPVKESPHFPFRPAFIILLILAAALIHRFFKNRKKQRRRHRPKMYL